MNTEFNGKEWCKLYLSPKELLILTEALNKIAEIRNQETPELEKPKEPAYLSFLQLAEKYEPKLKKLIDYLFLTSINSNRYSVAELYAQHIEAELCVSIIVSRKFVAEIYLTLLAKELNPENYNIDHKSEGEWNNIKWIPAYDYQQNEFICIEEYTKSCGSKIVFDDESMLKKSFTYSTEAITMFNWYFGEEGK